MNLFNKREEEKKQIKAAVDSPPMIDDLKWRTFWGSIDYVMELSYMRQSVNMNTNDSPLIEDMFINAIEDLRRAADNIVPQLRDHNEAMKQGIAKLKGIDDKK